MFLASSFLFSAHVQSFSYSDLHKLMMSSEAWSLNSSTSDSGGFFDLCRWHDDNCSCCVLFFRVISSFFQSMMPICRLILSGLMMSSSLCRTSDSRASSDSGVDASVTVSTLKWSAHLIEFGPSDLFSGACLPRWPCDSFVDDVDDVDGVDGVDGFDVEILILMLMLTLTHFKGKDLNSIFVSNFSRDY